MRNHKHLIFYSKLYNGIKIVMQKIRSAPSRILPSFYTALILIFLIALITQCRNEFPSAAAGNGGLLLPQNFEASVLVDSLGRARHLAVNDNGDVYVKLRNPYPDGSSGKGRRPQNDNSDSPGGALSRGGRRC